MEPAQTNPRILIVDDNPKNLQVLGKNLQLEKFDIEFAINGASTFEWLEATPFDLILLDGKDIRDGKTRFSAPDKS